MSAYSRDYSAKYRREVGECPVKRRRANSHKLKHRYGITVDERDALLDQQGGRCAICTRLIKFGAGKGLKNNEACIDHCHATGRVRGILCGLCNKGLGGFRDDPVAARAAADYLEKDHGAQEIRYH